jgi:hypothetical protein
MSTLKQAADEFRPPHRIVVGPACPATARPANLIYRRPRDAGREVFAVNPNAEDAEAPLLPLTVSCIESVGSPRTTDRDSRRCCNPRERAVQSGAGETLRKDERVSQPALGGVLLPWNAGASGHRSEAHHTSGSERTRQSRARPGTPSPFSCGAGRQEPWGLGARPNQGPHYGVQARSDA